MPDGDGEARVTRRYTIGGKARASVSRTHHSAVRDGRTGRGGLTTGVEAVVDGVELGLTDSSEFLRPVESSSVGMYHRVERAGPSQAANRDRNQKKKITQY